ncbi:hypothetical protein AGR9A_Cc210406 [Agrobacterium salinitolerans str. Hayward 0363]|nr:hypothetical protein AGR9A_Cc210406 [Agrobacterium salinitolerans str. Hayward 0363]
MPLVALRLKGVSGADLRNPVVQIIVVRYSTNFSVLQVEKGTGRQYVFLAIRLGQPFVGLEIFAIDDEFRGSTLAVVTRHDHHIGEVFPIAAVHVVHEGGKGGLAGLALALIDVMHHFIVKQRQEGIHVLTVEGIIIGADGLGSGHRLLRSMLARVFHDGITSANESENAHDRRNQVSFRHRRRASFR